MKAPNWTRVLTILLVVLAAYAILYIAGSILLRFTQAILLFVMGAIVAYVLTPLVNRLAMAFRFRWLAILLAYSFVAVGLLALSILLFTPFIQQSQSLVDNLRTPSAASLTTVTRVEAQATRIQSALRCQQRNVTGSGQPCSTSASALTADIATLQQSIRDLRTGTLVGPAPTGSHGQPTRKGKVPPAPQPRTQVPQSYVDLIAVHADALQQSYAQATRQPPSVDQAALRQAVTQANATVTNTQTVRHIMATTPILVLYAQRWLDSHHVRVDLHDKFGQATQQLSDQGTNILDNAITIVSETANTLLNTALILIISFYLLNDGGRLIRGGINLVPSGYREQVWYFMTSLDSVLGGYIRGQLFLSALAGVLGGGGAAFLGVPYPLLIGIMTFFLESVPVIGPMVAVVPAVAISLFFMPLLTTVALFAWFIVFQQIVTNVLGPRIMGMAVGIHPLEAILAVLLGYPLGGLLGAFLAVPVMGIVHILVREAYAYIVLGRSLPTAPVPEVEEYADTVVPAPAVKGPAPADR